VAVTSQYAITDPNYQPQERILNMTPMARQVFLAQYDLTRFDERSIGMSTQALLDGIMSFEGIRVAFIPVPKENLSNVGPGGDVMSSSSVASSSSFAGTGAGMGAESIGQQSRSHTGSASPTNLQQQQQQVLPQQQQQQQVSPQQQQMLPQQQQMQQLQSFPHTIRTTKNFVVNATSLVLPIRFLGGPFPPEVVPSNLQKKDVVPISDSPLFLNVSQLPSADNQAGRNHPLKPCMHLFLFCSDSPTPVIIVERYLREKSRILRVFNGNLELFGKIEATSTMRWMAKNRVVITGPDQESVLFVIKPAKTSFVGQSSSDYLIKKGTRRVGWITSKFAEKLSGPSTTSLTTTSSADLQPHDLYFPRPEGTNWTHRAMLIVATLYMDYLLGD
jgi:hypothetical protein